jgi:hypothetical protein
MNLLRLKEELSLIVRDSSLEDFYDNWINDAVLEIAADFELPDLKLKTPTTLSTVDFTSAAVTFLTADNSINATGIGTGITVGDNSTDVILVSGASESANNTKFTVTTATTGKLIVTETVTAETAGNTVSITYNWLHDLPATYHKKVFKCRNSNGDKITVGRRIQTIEEVDYDHDETDDYVTTIAVEADKIAIFPKAVDTLYLWFYRLPVDMTEDDDVPDGIPSAYHERVILPKVIIKNSAILQDLTLQYPPEYFRNLYSEGLYGRRGGDVGMINYLAKSKGFKRHGGVDPLP